MKTQITIGKKTINEPLIEGGNVIYIVKYEGQHGPFYTLICAKPDASQADLDRKLFLKDCSKGHAAFWAERVYECEFRKTGLLAFSQCLNEYAGGYARQIIQEFKF